MMNPNEIEEIKSITEDVLKKMTMEDFGVELKIPSVTSDNKDIVYLNIDLKNPQTLIGQNGQTLLEMQRILRIIFNKKLGKDFYLDLDINDYKKKKVEYLKNLAKESADEVSLTQKKKILSTMPAHERRIIHLELAQRTDVVTESQGDKNERYIVISPRPKT